MQHCIKGCNNCSDVWSCQEDTILSEAVHGIGPSKWGVIASLLEGRTAKQCRERWHNHLNVGIRKVYILYIK